MVLLLAPPNKRAQASLLMFQLHLMAHQWEIQRRGGFGTGLVNRGIGTKAEADQFEQSTEDHINMEYISTILLRNLRF